MKFSKSFAIFCVLYVAGASAFASQEESVRLNLPTSTDLVSLFGKNAGTSSLAALSSQEMKETEGAVAPWLVGGVVGGVMGGGGYAVGAMRGNYPFSTGRFIGNTATGVFFGATFGAAGAMAGGGMSAGANIWRANSAAANWGANNIWRQSCRVQDGCLF